MLAVKSGIKINFGHSFIKTCAILLFAALSAGCSSSPEKEREDLKKELSETKTESKKLETELSTLKKMEDEKEKKLAKPGEAATNKN